MATSRFTIAIGGVVLAAGCSSPPPPQRVPQLGPSLRIGVIDFFGLRQVTQPAARAALALKEGDTIPLDGEGRPPAIDESERALARVPGIARARLTLVCCEAGNGIVYVGVEEAGSPTFEFRPAPRGPGRLPDEIVETGREFTAALADAVRRGDSAEDVSHGQSLIRDPATRAVQIRLIEYAREPARFRGVLRDSSDSNHRALAAQILGYATNKNAVVGDLIHALGDPSEDVRNNAMRAVAIFARIQAPPTRATVRIPPEQLVALLGSPAWSDRNKASLALMQLTERPDSALLRLLRRQALVPLAEMARWKSEGHAMPAFMMLGRIAGRTDDEIQAAWTQGQREQLIESALRAGGPRVGRTR